MKPDELSPECGLGEHRFCTGPLVVRREGAPEWERPIMILRCGCTCHSQGSRSGR